MEKTKIEIVGKKYLEKGKVIPRYITFICKKCGNVWGVNTEWSENNMLTEKDLVCRQCAYINKYRNS